MEIAVSFELLTTRWPMRENVRVHIRRTRWPLIGAGRVGNQAGKCRVVGASFPPRKFLLDG